MNSRILALLAIPAAVLYQRRYDRVPVDWQDRLLRRLQKFVSYTHAHSQFYRDHWEQAGIHVGAITSIRDFERLPVIPRQEWLSASLSDLNPGARPVFWRETSGTSSGSPTKIPFTFEDELYLRVLAFSARFYHGLDWYQRVLMLAPPDPRFILPRTRFRWGRRVVSEPGSEEHIQALVHNSSRVVSAYSIVLWHAVMRASRRGLRLPRYKAVQVGGEVLTPTMRRTLSAKLGAPVRQVFGASDFGRMALDCRRSRLHVSPDAVHVEILRGEEPAPPGEVGEIVVTNFVSHARPLVRVRTGDFASWGTEPCECGSPIPYIEHVAGRQYDRIVTPGGQVIYWMHVEQALDSADGEILGYQVEQISSTGVLVRLAMEDPGASTDRYRGCLSDVFRAMSVDVVSTDKLRTEPSGKTRIMIGLPPVQQNPALNIS